jgi:hypothetical protein
MTNNVNHRMFYKNETGLSLNMFGHEEPADLFIIKIDVGRHIFNTKTFISGLI